MELVHGALKFDDTVIHICNDSKNERCSTLNSKMLLFEGIAAN